MVKIERGFSIDSAMIYEVSNLFIIKQYIGFSLSLGNHQFIPSGKLFSSVRDNQT